MIIHGGLIACRQPGGLWRGALIQGASGAGKSDLMLRALEAGWSLVADDRTLLWISGGRLFGRAAPGLVGLMEIRGLGVFSFPERPFAEVALVAVSAETTQIERMPDPEAKPLLGLAIPLIRLPLTQASSLAKLAYALTHVGLLAQPSYLACGAGGDHPDAGGVP